MMAYRAQEKLKLQLYVNIDNTNSVQDDEMQSIKDTQDTAKKTEDRGLLHSILTKVRRCICVYYAYFYVQHIILSLYSAGCNRNFD